MGLSDADLLASAGLTLKNPGLVEREGPGHHGGGLGLTAYGGASVAGEARVAWRPLPGPQVRFMSCPAFSVLFGGAVGGGKSDVGLAWVAEPAWHPEYVAVYFRRSYPEMAQMAERMRTVYGALGAAFSASQMAFRWPGGGVVYLRHLGHASDLDGYGSQSFCRVFFDELTTFEEGMWTFLHSRIRTPAPELRRYLGIRAATNPRGPGLPWVRELFLGTRGEPLVPGTIYRYRSTDATGREVTRTQCYIPSSLADNPYLDTPEYRASLGALSEADRRALEAGDWWAYEGAVFALRAGENLLTLAEARKAWGGEGPPSHWPRYRLMDWGFARPFAVVWVAVDGWGRGWVYREWYGAQRDAGGRTLPDVGLRLSPEEVAEGIVSREAGDVVRRAWAGPDLWHRPDGDDARPLGEGSHVAADTESKAERMRARGASFDPWLATPGSRATKRSALATALERPPRRSEGLGVKLPYAGLVLVEGLCPELIRTLPALVSDPSNPEAVDKRCEDHLYDALSAACVMRVVGPDAEAPHQGRQASLGEGQWARGEAVPWEVR